MRPFDGNATVGWHTPKHDPEAKRTVDVSIHVRKVQLQPAFSQTLQYLAAMHALTSSTSQYYRVRSCHRTLGQECSCCKAHEFAGTCRYSLAFMLCMLPASA
jgi:hypothetical protein